MGNYRSHARKLRDTVRDHYFEAAELLKPLNTLGILGYAAFNNSMGHVD